MTMHRKMTSFTMRYHENEHTHGGYLERVNIQWESWGHTEKVAEGLPPTIKLAGGPQETCPRDRFGKRGPIGRDSFWEHHRQRRIWCNEQSAGVLKVNRGMCPLGRPGRPMKNHPFLGKLEALDFLGARAPSKCHVVPSPSRSDQIRGY